MNAGVWMALFLLFFIISQNKKNEKQMLLQLMQKRKTEGNTNMLELAKTFIGKECIIYTFNSQLEGTIQEVSEGAVLLKRADSSTEAVNLSFVVRIREYPLNKKGKKKSVIVD